MKKLATVIASTVLIGTPAFAADMAVKEPVTQDYRYLVHYVWSELPPAEKPADIVLSSLKNTPVGTPVEEIKRLRRSNGGDANLRQYALFADHR